jgi:peptide/nickel transport system substrate-binding protein
MKKVLFYFSIAVGLAACSGLGGNPNEGNGGRIYGGIINVNETEKFRTLFPHNINDIISSNIAFQVFEGLVKFNPKNITEVVPCIAESWTVDATGTVYTFKLKSGVKFHDDACFPEGKGRELTANDVKFSFELLCTQSKYNTTFNGSFKDRVKGANEYYTNSANGKPNSGLEGLKIVDDHTVEITLTQPSSSFLYVLASPSAFIIAKEGYEKYGNLLKFGTGPFVAANADPKGDKVILVKNKNYHGVDSLGNKLPFIDSVIVTFIPSKSRELDAFKNGDLDVVFGLPSESVKEIVSQQIEDFQNKPPKFIIDRTAELGTQYYEFNTTMPPFNNPKVRRAFNFAINKETIVENVLRGEAFSPGNYGICSQSLSGYDVTKLRGYKFNPDSAKQLLKEAGYPDGKGFPVVKIMLNSGGNKNSKVVEEIKKQLMEVLNVTVDFDIVPFAQKLDDAQHARSANMYRAGWTADFPSPENFLFILYGKNVPDSLSQPSVYNIPRYKNAEYDKYFELGRTAKTKDESYAAFLMAEQIMINDAPIMVLWYTENMKLAHGYLKNFYFNALNYNSYTEVYLKKEEVKSEDKKEESHN